MRISDWSSDVCSSDLYGPQAMIPPEDAKIVISAMHGYYFDMVERGWKLQRPTRSNEIYEDFMTQKFVDPLVNWIFARYGGSVRLARSRSLHTPPGGLYPCWNLDEIGRAHD